MKIKGKEEIQKIIGAEEEILWVDGKVLKKANRTKIILRPVVILWILLGVIAISLYIFNPPEGTSSLKRGAEILSWIGFLFIMNQFIDKVHTSIYYGFTSERIFFIFGVFKTKVKYLHFDDLHHIRLLENEGSTKSTIYLIPKPDSQFNEEYFRTSDEPYPTFNDVENGKALLDQLRQLKEQNQNVKETTI